MQYNRNLKFAISVISGTFDKNSARRDEIFGLFSIDREG